MTVLTIPMPPYKNLFQFFFKNFIPLSSEFEADYLENSKRKKEVVTYGVVYAWSI